MVDDRQEVYLEAIYDKNLPEETERRRARSTFPILAKKIFWCNSLYRDKFRTVFLPEKQLAGL